MNKITLKANFETGEGDVGNLKKWREVPALLRADLLKDWLVELEGEYQLAISEAFEPQYSKLTMECLQHGI
jgi:hypothetical protein